MGTCTACSVLDGGVGRLGAPRRRALPFRLRSILASTCDPPTTESVSSDVGNRNHALHTRMSEDSRCCHGHRHGWQRAWRWCGHTCEGYRKKFLRSAGNQSKENFSCYLPHQGNQSAGSRKTYPSPTHMMSLCPVPLMPRPFATKIVPVRPHARPCQPFSRGQSAKRYILTHIRVHQPYHPYSAL